MLTPNVGCVAADGLGKSQLTAFISARTLTGGAWPCGEGDAQQGSVLFLSAGDVTIRERFGVSFPSRFRLSSLECRFRWQASRRSNEIHALLLPLAKSQDASKRHSTYFR